MRKPIFFLLLFLSAASSAETLTLPYKTAYSLLKPFGSKDYSLIGTKFVIEGSKGQACHIDTGVIQVLNDRFPLVFSENWFLLPFDSVFSKHHGQVKVNASHPENKNCFVKMKLIAKRRYSTVLDKDYLQNLQRQFHDFLTSQGKELGENWQDMPLVLEFANGSVQLIWKQQTQDMTLHKSPLVLKTQVIAEIDGIKLSSTDFDFSPQIQSH